MRPLALALTVLLGPAALVAEGRTELEILRARCTEQERQIRTLEVEIENLHSQIALERRRARGAALTTPESTPAATPAPAKASWRSAMALLTCTGPRTGTSRSRPLGSLKRHSGP